MIALVEIVGKQVKLVATCKLHLSFSLCEQNMDTYKALYSIEKTLSQIRTMIGAKPKSIVYCLALYLVSPKNTAVLRDCKLRVGWGSAHLPTQCAAIEKFMVQATLPGKTPHCSVAEHESCTTSNDRDSDKTATVSSAQCPKPSTTDVASADTQLRPTATEPAPEDEDVTATDTVPRAEQLEPADESQQAEGPELAHPGNPHAIGNVQPCDGVDHEGNGVHECHTAVVTCSRDTSEALDTTCATAAAPQPTDDTLHNNMSDYETMATGEGTTGSPPLVELAEPAAKRQCVESVLELAHWLEKL